MHAMPVCTLWRGVLQSRLIIFCSTIKGRKKIAKQCRVVITYREHFPATGYDPGSVELCPLQYPPNIISGSVTLMSISMRSTSGGETAALGETGGSSPSHNTSSRQPSPLPLARTHPPLSSPLSPPFACSLSEPNSSDE